MSGTSALVDRSVLQSAGIETFFFNENMSSLGAPKMGSVEDLESAKQFLEQEAMLDSTRSEDSGEIGIEDKPVVLRVYRDMPAAYVAKSVLDAAGIRCFLQDANVVRLDWFWSNTMGGIKLVVREADAEDAAKILDLAPSELPDEAKD